MQTDKRTPNPFQFAQTDYNRNPIRAIEDLDDALDRDSQVANALRATVKEQEALQ